MARQFATMGGELGISVGPDTTSISTEVLSERAADAVRLHRRCRTASAAARIGARTRQGRPAAQSGDPEEHAAGRRAGEVREAALRRSSLRPASSRTEAALEGLHARAGPNVPPGSLRRRARTAVRRRGLRRSSRWRRRSDRRSRGGTGAEATRRQVPPAAGTPLRAHRSSGRAAVDRHARAAGADPVAQGLGRARSHRRAPWRRVRVPHHDEHPRAEGLHLFALQHARDAPGAGQLGRRRPTSPPTSPARRSRKSFSRSIGCGKKRRQPPSSTGSRTTWPASSSSRTRRATASSAGSTFVDRTGSATRICPRTSSE